MIATVQDAGSHGSADTVTVIISTWVYVAAVSTSAGHTMILKMDGTLWGTGWNYYGQRASTVSAQP